MSNEPLRFERTYKAPVAKVWRALTDRDEMSRWYFDLEEFRAEPGFEFSFTGGTEHKQYLHLCRVTEVIPEKKLAYTWRYDGYAGDSLVTFELFPEGDETRLVLTHAGLHTFPADEAGFNQNNFKEGWTYITGTSLKNYLEGQAS